MQDPTSAGDQTDRLLERLALEKTALENALSQPSASATESSNSLTAQGIDIPIADELIEDLIMAIEQLYLERLNHSPQRVNCDLLANRLVVWIEGSITPVEKLLFSEETPESRRVCFRLDQLMNRQLVALIERHLNLRVVTVVADTCYEYGCTGLIAKLTSTTKIEDKIVEQS